MVPGRPTGVKDRGPLLGTARPAPPPGQVRSKFRASSQSVTARLAAAHSWRAVLRRCSWTSGPKASAATLLDSKEAMASGRVAGTLGASLAA